MFYFLLKGKAEERRYVIYRAGATRYASTILILKPIPTITKLNIRYLNLPFSAAINRAQHASTKDKTSKLSIVLFLLDATNIGVTARHSAAISPAEFPKDLLTR